MKKLQWLALCAAFLSFGSFAIPAYAAVTEITITKVQPAFEGQSFGSAGAYERVEGTIKGAVDPKNPLNSKIVDIGADKSGGPVGYSANFMIFRPVDASKGNHKVVYDINNRGNMLTFGLFNDAPKYNNDPLSKADAGNGFLMRQGYTIAVSGWDSVSPDMPGIGAGPFKLTVPIAVNADGSPIVGPAMEEYAVDDGKTEKGRLTYQTADSDTATASLMVRTLVDDQPTTIAADKWQFDPDGMSISLKPSGTKFEAGKLFNLVYQAKNPKIAGLGYAAVRDFAVFLRSDKSSPIPKVDKILATCDSQPCRFLHDYVELGFNQSETGIRAIDGVLNWEGGGSGLYLNYRFA
ncbi:MULTISPECIES: alpha/beta hydrolase domain-containing protein [unclassified Rhizobium]|nr:MULTISPECIES: alpha/beta hydrolase domain-containing protein [unclassified Rhizobium]MBO9100996.1 hypothetical protein [Rhizobium sp. L58/93]QXZ86037.1 hypothetical protein J5287_23310 [Rhizobium sp. K1/93]QXZ92505.1 hypothetical protein J5280_25880 [Rhizobium sp. K15/93]